jgi:hypothetical protein
MARDIFGNKKGTKEDRYTRSRNTFTKVDERWIYFKMFIYLFLGYCYFHFVVMGWKL